MIVKHSLLRSRIIEDIYFKKSTEQLKEEEEREKKARDDETEKICPKCRQAYILSKTNFGNCRYHDGYVFHVGGKNPINIDDAQTILQAAKLSQARSSNDQHPKLVWACCLGIYGSDPPCRIGICGLPQELQATHSEVANQIEAVEKHFRKNPKADAKIKAFVETYGNLPKPSPQL
jgi:ssDNA-binding Zn-finger/Zn-ribbon topoisomerase 1